jgi:glucose-6-phosphate 1-epimerase
MDETAMISFGNGISTVAATAHGAQVLSWDHAGKERLFVSPKASVSPGQAIRGGMPVIFPQFGTRGAGPRHGFARHLAWEAIAGETGQDSVRFRLRQSAETLRVWAHEFEAQISACLIPHGLSVELAVRNTGRRPFSFTCALHTYLRINDIGAIRIEGLQGVAYQDATRSGSWDMQRTPFLVFQGEVDRVYRDCGERLVLVDGESRTEIRQNGFRDVVAWNPGPDLAARMPDLGPGGHREFVCIEAGAIHEPIELAPGDAWDGSQVLIV